MSDTEEHLYEVLKGQIRQVEEHFAMKYPGIAAEVPFVLAGSCQTLLAFRRTGKRWALHVLHQYLEDDAPMQRASAATALSNAALSDRLAAGLLLPELEKALASACAARLSDLEQGVTLYANFLHESNGTCTNESPTSAPSSASPSNPPVSAKTRKRVSSPSK